ncbi:hypothetical protein [Gordonibacter sp.]|uniref:hypothetical protein n=1 Tax=Gordonibacter sp. TaxID=1968902 RepID=UPI0025C10D2D|nr:hypothetical protein [Gordonibacter sp.]
MGGSTYGPAARRVVDVAQDTRGASILIALLFFLVCALVGAVVLTAATVSTGQLVDYEKSQQAYYSTTSAAELFRDELVGGTYTVSGEDYTCAFADANTSVQNFIAGAVKSQNTTSNPLAPSAATATLKVSAPADNDTLKDVTARLTMGGKNASTPFDLRITFSPTVYDGAVGNYQVVLTIPASCLYDEAGTTLQSITWKDAVITKSPRQTESS